MENKELIGKLSELGFPLFVDDAKNDANETIAALVQSNNARLWEGFPVVLANAARNHWFDRARVENKLKNAKARNAFRTLFIDALGLYSYLNVQESWSRRLFKEIDDDDKKTVQKLVMEFSKQKDLVVANKHLSTGRLKDCYEKYSTHMFANDQKNAAGNYQELALDHAMAQLFTARQKEIFLKRVQGKPMTKTEREYFYRVIKKKAIALANRDLHSLAQKAIA